MREVVIQIPDFDPDQKIEIEVRINGKRRIMEYRVEIVEWEKELQSTEDKVNRLRTVIQAHDKDWQLVELGAETRNNIQVMFRKRMDKN